jgi:hypothetical protein
VSRETNLDSVLSIRRSRTLDQDHTIRWEGVIYRVHRKQIASGMRGARVQVERRTGRKPVDALANPNPVTGALPSQSTAARRESRQNNPSCTGKIGTGESPGQTATARCPPTLVGSLHAFAQSTDLASHEKSFAANGNASIALCEGQGIQHAIPCPSRTPIPASKAELSTLQRSGTFYFALTARADF